MFHNFKVPDNSDPDEEIEKWVQNRVENNNNDENNAELFADKSEASDFNSYQSKEIDKIAHQAYNNVDFEVKKEFNK